MAARVSVIMPVYNGERFLQAAVESILAQTLGDFTLIVVDDASTDGTPDILRSCAAGDSRVRIHRLTQNGGAIAARNTGLTLADAPLIATMDADDVSLPQRLERQVSFMDARPDVGVVGSFVQLIDEAGSRGQVKTYPSTPGLTAWALFFLNSIAHPTAMVRRSIMQELVGYASGCKGGTEDFEMFTRASRITRLANVPEVLVLYRQWQGNMTSVHWNNQESDADRIVYESVAEHLGAGKPQSLAPLLRGLATERYPGTLTEIQTLADVVQRLHDSFLKLAPIEKSSHGEVTRDAAVKLWLLGVLALRYSPAAAATLAGRSLRMDPGAAVAFAIKAARRLRR